MSDTAQVDLWNPRISEIDPRLASIAAAASAFRDAPDWPAVATWNPTLLVHGFGVPVQFVPQLAPIRRRAGTRAPYDEQITTHAKVPSREQSWHDFLNMLTWATFPKTKLALHHRQLAAAAREDPTTPRGRERDALSMLDEGGILIVRRPDAQETHLVFGHALLEHLVTGRTLELFAAALAVTLDEHDLDTTAALRVSTADELRSPRALPRVSLSPRPPNARAS